MADNIFDWAERYESEQSAQTTPNIFDFEESLKSPTYAEPSLSIFDFENINRYGIPITPSFLELQEKLKQSSNLSTESDLEEKADPGMLAAFGRGFGAGLLPFGIYEPNVLETPTTAEKTAEVVGGVAGSIVPFIVGSLFTGGAAVPALGARTMAAAGTLQRIGRANKQIKKLNKLASKAEGAEKSRYLSRINSLEKGKSKYTAQYKKLQDEFIEEQISKGVPTSKISQITKRGLPQASGQILGRMPGYQDYLLGLAKSGPQGAKWANAVNRGVNNLITFTGVGQVYRPLSSTLEERVTGLKDDTIAATAFTVAALPKIFWSANKTGLKSLAAGKVGEYGGIFMAGAYSDFGMNKDMTIEDRMIHGLALMGVHYGGQALGRVGVKQKAFNALTNLGIQPEVALRIVEGERVNKIWDAVNNEVKVQGDYWRNKKNPDHFRYIEKGNMYESEDGKFFEIKFIDSQTGEVDYIRKPSKSDALKELDKNFYRERREKEVIREEKELVMSREPGVGFGAMPGLKEVKSKEILRTIATPEERGTLSPELAKEKEHWNKTKKIIKKNLDESKRTITRDAEVEALDVDVKKPVGKERKLWDLRTWHSEGSKESDAKIEKIFYEESSSGEFTKLRLKAGENAIVPAYRGRGYGGFERSFNYQESSVGRIEAVGEKDIVKWMKDNPDKFVDKDGVLKYDNSTILIRGKNTDPAEFGSTVYYLAKVGRKSNFSNELGELVRTNNFNQEFKDKRIKILEWAGDTALFHSVDPNKPFNRRESRRTGEAIGKMGKEGSGSYDYTSEHLKKGEPVYFYIAGPKGAKIKLSNKDQSIVREFYKDKNSVIDQNFLDKLILKYTGGKGMTTKEYNELPESAKKEMWGEKYKEAKREKQYIFSDEYQGIANEVLRKHFGLDKDATMPIWKAEERYGEQFTILYEKAIKKRSRGPMTAVVDPGAPYRLRMFVRDNPISETLFRDFLYGRKKLINPETGKEIKVPGYIQYGSRQMSPKKFQEIREGWANYESENRLALEKKLFETKKIVEDIESGQLKEADITKLSTDAKDPSPELLTEFQTSMSNRNIDEVTPMYKLKLNKFIDNRKISDKEMKKQTPYLFTDNELLFRTEQEAIDWARNHWSTPEAAQKILQSKYEQASAKVDRLNPDKVVRSRRKYERILREGFKKQNFKKKEQEVLISTIVPESKGKIENLSEYGLRMVSDYIMEPSIKDVNAELRFNLSTPNNTFGSKISSTFRKSWRNLNEAIFPTSNIIEWFDTPASIEVSRRRMKPFTRTRQAVHGPMTEALNDMSRNVGVKIDGYGNPMKSISKYLSAFIDDAAFGKFRNHKNFIEFEKKLKGLKIEVPGFKGDGIEYLKWRHQNMMDEVWTVLAGSGAWIVDGRGKRRRMVRLYDSKSGKEFNYVDYFKDPVSWDAQSISFLDYAKGKRKTALNYVDGQLREVNVNSKKSKLFYEEPFLHRVTSERFKELFSTDDNAFKMITKNIMENDKEIMLLKGKEKLEAAEEKARTLQKIITKPGIYGQVHARVANLPPFVYVKRVNDRVVDMIEVSPDFTHLNEKGEFYKAGDKIKDRRSVSHTIDEVIPVYENNYGKAMEQYVRKVPHFAATSLVYGNKKTGLPEYEGLAKRIERETGDKAAGQFALEQMELQIHGQEVGGVENALRWSAEKSALTGLSFPISGLKNGLVGNVMNATVFTSRDLIGGMRTLFTGGSDRPLKDFSLENWKNERSLTRRIGAEYTSNYALFMADTPLSGFAKRWIGNLGGMRTTEFANRMISSVTGYVSLKNHIHNFAGIETPGNKGISLSQSRRILQEVFEFSPREIEQMVDRYRIKKESVKDLSPKQQMEILNQDLFNTKELTQARQQAHMITQGSPDLPYVPYWMGRAWAKPLTLFYRIAYRVTNAITDNAIMPIITDGNMMPAMKYIGLNIPVGMGLYSVYNWALGEERQNQFKSMPAEYLDYFIKAEGLGMFSNLVDDYGGFGEAYNPVIIRNTQEFLSNVQSYLTGKKTLGQATDDGLSSIVAAYNGWKRVILNLSGDKKKLVSDSRRRQYQFLDTFFPKEDTSLDYDDMLTTKTPYYRALSDVFWSGSPRHMAHEYYASLAYVRDRFMHEQQLSYYVAEKKAREILKRLISRQRPIPSSWRKAEGRKSKYLDYMNKITPSQRESEKELDSLYMDYKSMFWKAVNDYKDIYYKKG